MSSYWDKESVEPEAKGLWIIVDLILPPSTSITKEQNRANNNCEAERKRLLPIQTKFIETYFPYLHPTDRNLMYLDFFILAQLEWGKVPDQPWEPGQPAKPEAFRAIVPEKYQEILKGAGAREEEKEGTTENKAETVIVCSRQELFNFYQNALALLKTAQAETSAL